MSTQMELISIAMQMGLHPPTPDFRLSIMIPGQSGVGKTACIRAVTKAVEEMIKRPFPFEHLSLPQIQAEEMCGLPVPDMTTLTTRLLPLHLGKQVLEAHAGAILLDEYGSASHATGAATLNFSQNGILGERTLPSSVVILAAMNPADCAANGRDLSPPESNRFLWVYWTLDVNDWIDYMIGGKGAVAHVRKLPATWTEFLPRTRSMISSFVKRHTARFHEQPAAHDASKPWPSPRSWENAAAILAAVMATGAPPLSELALMAVNGCVGDAAGGEFVEWLRKMDLPDPEEILKNPTGYDLSGLRSDRMAATLDSVAVAAVQKLPDAKKMLARYDAAWVVVSKVMEHAQDLALSAASILAAPGVMPPAGKIPAAAVQILHIRRKIGITQA